MKISDGVLVHLIVWSLVGLFILGAGIAGFTRDWMWVFLGVPYGCLVIWAMTEKLRK